MCLKDEAGRFGLGSFKALGGAYAVAGVLASELARAGVAQAATSVELASGRYREATAAVTVTCATDGNHGRSVAWGAQRFHCRCVIFVHAGVSRDRVDAIARYGAEVRRVGGTYDDSVREAARQAEAHGWFVVSDTSWPGYTEVPREVMQGYRLMADEAADQWDGAPPTHVFIQGGVGGVAAAVSVQIARALPPRAGTDRGGARPCGLPAGERRTRRANRHPGRPGHADGGVWPAASRAWLPGRNWIVPRPPSWRSPTRRPWPACGCLPDRGIVAGESGVAGLAGFLLAAADPAARETLGLDGSSRVLLFSTEGATDSAMYRELVGRTPESVGA